MTLRIALGLLILGMVGAGCTAEPASQTGPSAASQQRADLSDIDGEPDGLGQRAECHAYAYADRDPHSQAEEEDRTRSRSRR